MVSGNDTMDTKCAECQAIAVQMRVGLAELMKKQQWIRAFHAKTFTIS